MPVFHGRGSPLTSTEVCFLTGVLWFAKTSTKAPASVFYDAFYCHLKKSHLPLVGHDEQLKGEDLSGRPNWSANKNHDLRLSREIYGKSVI
jgi:hypothetical protein